MFSVEDEDGLGLSVLAGIWCCVTFAGPEERPRSRQQRMRTAAT